MRFNARTFPKIDRELRTNGSYVFSVLLYSDTFSLTPCIAENIGAPSTARFSNTGAHTEHRTWLVITQLFIYHAKLIWHVRRIGKCENVYSNIQPILSHLFKQGKELLNQISFES
jgi:hypothetical protein